jgi:hypothetical protein
MASAWDAVIVWRGFVIRGKQSRSITGAETAIKLNAGRPKRTMLNEHRYCSALLLRLKLYQRRVEGVHQTHSDGGGIKEKQKCNGRQNDLAKHSHGACLPMS